MLAEYAVDPREVYASHARQVLENGSQSSINDGLWSGTALSSEWGAGSNWQNGVPAGGMGATAIFTNDLPDVQTISLGTGLVNIGTLIFGGSDRTIVDGTLDISAQSPAVSVAADARVTVESEVISGATLIKSGEGTLAMAGAMTLSGVDLIEGTFVLSDPDAVFYRAYAANTSDHNSSSTVPRNLRCDFRVNSAIMITALGAYDSEGDGFESFKKVALHIMGNSTPLVALGFSPAEEYALEGGYRFRQLPEPLVLQPGDYSIVTYGFLDSDRYVVGSKGGLGAQVGTVESGGVLSFLTNAFYSSGGVLSYPIAAGGPASDYAVSAGSFQFVTGAYPKKIVAPVSVAKNATLDVAAVKMTFEQGLIPGAGGLGIVSNASAAHPVSLTLGVLAGTTNTMAGSAIGNRSDGPLTLVKEGDGTLQLSGALGFDGGLHIKQGQLAVDSPASLRWNWRSG